MPHAAQRTRLAFGTRDFKLAIFAIVASQAGGVVQRWLSARWHGQQPARKTNQECPQGGTRQSRVKTFQDKLGQCTCKISVSDADSLDYDLDQKTASRLPHISRSIARPGTGHSWENDLPKRKKTAPVRRE